MINKTTKYLLSVSLVGLLVTGALYIWLFLDVKEKNEQVSAISSDLEFEVKQEARLNDLEELLINIGEERDVVTSYFMNEGGIVDFIQGVESLASGAGVTIDINRVAIDELDKSSGASSTLDIEFELTGSWRRIYHMISLLELAPDYKGFSRVFLEYNDDERVWRSIVTLRVPVYN